MFGKELHAAGMTWISAPPAALKPSSSYAGVRKSLRAALDLDMRMIGNYHRESSSTPLDRLCRNLEAGCSYHQSEFAAFNFLYKLSAASSGFAASSLGHSLSPAKAPQTRHEACADEGRLRCAERGRERIEASSARAASQGLHSFNLSRCMTRPSVFILEVSRRESQSWGYNFDLQSPQSFICHAAGTSHSSRKGGDSSPMTS